MSLHETRMLLVNVLIPNRIDGRPTLFRVTRGNSVYTAVAMQTTAINRIHNRKLYYRWPSMSGAPGKGVAVNFCLGSKIYSFHRDSRMKPKQSGYQLTQSFLSGFVKISGHSGRDWGEGVRNPEPPGQL